MQLAINVVIFVLGFSLASWFALKPQKQKKDLESLARDVHGQGNGRQKLSSQHDVLLKSESETGSNLLTIQEVEAKFDMDTWQRLAYEELKTKILGKETGSKTFPCIYATMGYRSGDHRYVFLESDDPSEPRNIRLIGPALKEYLEISRSLGPNTSLVIMAAPTEGGRRTVEEYNQAFWEMLKGLRIWDTKPWPKDIPQDTNNANWTFCFDGQPLFPVALTPAHERRFSRHAPVPVIALQPKWVLDRLLATPEKRNSATGKVRKLLVEYDQTEISPDLTSYGQAGTSEVHQLCLLDVNVQAGCPYDNFDKARSSSPSSPPSSRRTSLELA